MKKVIVSCLKMNPLCMYMEGWCVGLGPKEGCLREDGENCLKYLKGMG